jgi:hypothetical protein
VELPEVNRGRRRGWVAGGAAALALLVGCGTVEDAPPEAVAGSLIDDLDDGDRYIPAVDGRMGRWHTLNDGTGTQTPPPQTFAATSGGAEDSPYCIATAGSGFTAWGAKIGVFLNIAEVGDPDTYDLSAYRGVRFHARGNALVRATVLTEAVRGTSTGGACDESLGGCFDYHGLSFALTDDWREYSMDFDALAQEGWGQAIELDPAGAMELGFSVSAGVDFAFAIDSVRVY